MRAFELRHPDPERAFNNALKMKKLTPFEPERLSNVLLGKNLSPDLLETKFNLGTTLILQEKMMMANLLNVIPQMMQACTSVGRRTEG